MRGDLRKPVVVAVLPVPGRVEQLRSCRDNLPHIQLNLGKTSRAIDRLQETIGKGNYCFPSSIPPQGVRRCVSRADRGQNDRPGNRFEPHGPDRLAGVWISPCPEPVQPWPHVIGGYAELAPPPHGYRLGLLIVGRHCMRFAVCDGFKTVFTPYSLKRADLVPSPNLQALLGPVIVLHGIRRRELTELSVPSHGR